MNDRPRSDGDPPERRKRRGSRLLLAVSLLAGIASALVLGATIPEMIAGIAGVGSGIVRLALKVVGVIVALPIAFYLVEKLFLSRSRRRDS